MSGSWVLVILVLVSSLPVIAVYIWFLSAKYQLSLVQFLLALLAGAAAIFPALVLQDLLNFSFTASIRVQLFYQFFIRVALIEELSRLLMMFIFLWISALFFKATHIKPDEDPNHNHTICAVKKGTAIGLIGGLGFSILESARHMASHMDIGLLLLRFFTAALHGACGSRIGAAAVLFRTNPIQSTLRIFTATAIHGIYNFMVTIPGIPVIAAFLIAVSALISALLILRGGWTLDKTHENL